MVLFKTCWVTSIISYTMLYAELVFERYFDHTHCITLQHIQNRIPTVFFPQRRWCTRKTISITLQKVTVRTSHGQTQTADDNVYLVTPTPSCRLIRACAVVRRVENFLSALMS